LANRLHTLQKLDWLTIGIYLVFILLGWLNIYAADYNPDHITSIFDFHTRSGRQFIWIMSAFSIIVFIYVIDYKIIEAVSYIIFGLSCLLLVLVLLIGSVKSGARSWIDLGAISLQPSEFAKIASCLALSKYLSIKNQKNQQNKYLFFSCIFIYIPVVLILLQNDTGSLLVYFSLILVLYINGIKTPLFFAALGFVAVFILALAFSKVYLITSFSILSLVLVYFFRKKRKIVVGIGSITSVIFIVIFGTQFFVNNILQEHQRKRIEVIFNPELDPKGAGWNTTQSKIAIGSGGFSGKGFLNGNITKGDFVPEQFTDFIFCTIGEEHGFIGSLFIVVMFVFLLLRLIFLAERQKSHFAYLYGYSVVSIIFFHFLINIGMALGILPVIGIPLPFFSYGGSSLWSFTILLFIFIKLDAHRSEVLARR